MTRNPALSRQLSLDLISCVEALRGQTIDLEYSGGGGGDGDGGILGHFVSVERLIISEGLLGLAATCISDGRAEIFKLDYIHLVREWPSGDVFQNVREWLKRHGIFVEVRGRSGLKNYRYVFTSKNR